MNNYEQLALVIEQVRESFRAMVAGLMADGFTDEQARELIVAVLKKQSGGEDG